MLSITARSACIGFHRWPDAPTARGYLAFRHRHEFRIAATVAVDHDGRAVEFHDLQADIARDVASLADDYTSDAYEFGTRSCEALARGLAGLLSHRGYLVLSVVWSEDGQNDATWTPDVIPNLLEFIARDVAAEQAGEPTVLIPRQLP